MRKTHDTSISLVFFLCIHTRYQSSSLPFRVGGFWIPQNLAGGFSLGWSKFKERYQSLPPTHSQPIRCMMPMSQHRLNIQIPPQKVFKTYIYIYKHIIFWFFRSKMTPSQEVLEKYPWCSKQKIPSKQLWMPYALTPIPSWVFLPNLPGISPLLQKHTIGPVKKKSQSQN